MLTGWKWFIEWSANEGQKEGERQMDNIQRDGDQLSIASKRVNLP